MTTQNSSDDGLVVTIKVAIGWFGYFFGSLALNDVSLFLVVCYTLLQIITHLRKEYGLFARTIKE